MTGTWFVSTDKYEREIEGPNEEKATVTFRRLNAGDQAAITDILRMEEEAGMKLALGTARMLTVQRAVVDWTIPGPKPTPETLALLDPDVFEQIYANVELGSLVELPTEEPSETEAKLVEEITEAKGPKAKLAAVVADES